jgi:hypothetical protein
MVAGSLCCPRFNDVVDPIPASDADLSIGVAFSTPNSTDALMLGPPAWFGLGNKHQRPSGGLSSFAGDRLIRAAVVNPLLNRTDRVVRYWVETDWHAGDLRIRAGAERRLALQRQDQI